jgi:hypothetical protein
VKVRDRAGFARDRRRHPLEVVDERLARAGPPLAVSCVRDVARLPRTVHVTGMKGPLEDDWQKKVEAFANQIPVSPEGQDSLAGPVPAA